MQSMMTIRIHDRTHHPRRVRRRGTHAENPRGQKISEREADAALSNYRAFPVERQDVLPLWPRLKSLHANLSAYDAQYVALAEAFQVSLITADARIKRSGVARCNVEVFDAHTGRPYLRTVAAGSRSA